MILTGSELPPAFIALAYLVAGAVAFLLHDNVQRDRKRAAAADHVVEASRDVAVPDHCVQCGIARAPVIFDFFALRFGVSPLAAAFDARFKKKYRFRFCRSCAVPVRRHRRIGQSLVIIGLLLLAGLPLVLGVGSILADALHLSSTLLWDGIYLSLFGGPGLFLAGTIVKALAGSRIVSVLDTGGEKVLFRFRNQVYRNHFAELNGEQ